MNHLIEIELEKLGIPFSYLEHSSDDDTYIVYTDYDGRPGGFADNKEIMESYYYQFDIFSKSNLTQIEQDLKGLLFLLGGLRLSQFSHFELGYYQKSIRFRFDKEKF